MKKKILFLFVATLLLSSCASGPTEDSNVDVSGESSTFTDHIMTETPTEVEKAEPGKATLYWTKN